MMTAAIVLAALLPLAPLANAQNSGAVRFFGSGSAATPNRDRVNIPVDDNLPGSVGHTPADIGDGSFTVEFWIRGTAVDNPATTGLSAGSHAGIAWTEGHVVVDRDTYTTISQPGDARDWGVSIIGGRIAFGTGFDSALAAPQRDTEATLLGSVNVLTGSWTHVAVVRDAATGRKSILVNGSPDVTSVAHPSNDNLSYPDSGLMADYSGFGPYLVLGAEKHDYPGSRYFRGDFDELRLWSTARATDEIRAARRTLVDPGTAGLAAWWRFEEAAGTTVTNSVPGAPAGVLIANLPGNGLRLSTAGDPANTPALSGPDNYTDWSILHLSNPTDRAPALDPDTDGAPNLTEFALGTHPAHAASAPRITPVLSGQRGGLNFLRARSDVIYTLRGTSTLAAWQTLTSTQGPGGQHIVLEDNQDITLSNPRFLRLQLTIP